MSNTIKGVRLSGLSNDVLEVDVEVDDPMVCKWIKRGWVTGVSTSHNVSSQTGECLSMCGQLSFLYAFPWWYRIYLWVLKKVRRLTRKQAVIQVTRKED